MIYLNTLLCAALICVVAERARLMSPRAPFLTRYTLAIFGGAALAMLLAPIVFGMQLHPAILFFESAHLAMISSTGHVSRQMTRVRLSS